MSDSDNFDPRAAGAYIGGTKPIAVQTLAIHRLRGTGPSYFKVGNLVRYRRSDLEAWIASHMRSNTGERLN